MAKKKKVITNKDMYKGYSIKWLRELPEHPDYHLVAEYDKSAKRKKK